MQFLSVSNSVSNFPSTEKNASQKMDDDFEAAKARAMNKVFVATLDGNENNNVEETPTNRPQPASCK